MSLSGLGLILFSAVSMAAANLLLREGVARIGGFALRPDVVKDKLLLMVQEPIFLGGFFLYAVVSLLWFRVISTEELSSGYPILIGTAVVLVNVGAVLFFQEQIGLQKASGIALILGGIIVIALA